MPEGTIAGPETSKANNQAWYDGATLYAAIGQENNQFTPLQIANYLATLVNGGDRYSVHLLDSVRSHDNSELLYQYEPELLSSIGIPEDYLATIKEGMYQVSQNAAIARYFNNLPVRVGAKTGTAEIQGGEDSETNGLLVVFAPYDDPEIALCIVMEQGRRAAPWPQWPIRFWTIISAAMPPLPALPKRIPSSPRWKKDIAGAVKLLRQCCFCNQDGFLGSLCLVPSGSTR